MIHLITILLVISPSDNVANIAFALYFVAIDWTMLSLFFFCSSYTKYVFYRDAFHKILTILTILDTVSLFLNYRFHHVFKITDTKLIFTRGELLFWPSLLAFLLTK